MSSKTHYIDRLHNLIDDEYEARACKDIDDDAKYQRVALLQPTPDDFIVVMKAWEQQALLYSSSVNLFESLLISVMPVSAQLIRSNFSSLNMQEKSFFFRLTVAVMSFIPAY